MRRHTVAEYCERLRTSRYKDREERIQLNQGLTPSDVVTIVTAANELDSKAVAEWMAVRGNVKKRITALLASNPELRQQLADEPGPPML